MEIKSILLRAECCTTDNILLSGILIVNLQTL